MTKTMHVHNLKGDKLDSTIELDIFSAKVKPSLIHLLCVDFLAKRRSGSASAKTRAEVRGGGHKPWAQKGTGRARASSLRSPLFRGGGVIFGPKPRSYGGAIPKSIKHEALKSALLNKKSKIFVVKELEVKEGKTREVVELLKAFKVQSALFVDEKFHPKFLRAAGNIAAVKTLPVRNINVYDILKYDSLFLTVPAGKKLAEVLK
jgi:large subunit ribosomal protein L4